MKDKNFERLMKAEKQIRLIFEDRENIKVDDRSVDTALEEIHARLMELKLKTTKEGD